MLNGPALIKAVSCWQQVGVSCRFRLGLACRARYCASAWQWSNRFKRGCDTFKQGIQENRSAIGFPVTTMKHPSYPHAYPFDPAYGLDQARLLAIEPPVPPADFADFWRARHQAVLAIDPLPRLDDTGQLLGSHRVHGLRYTSSDSVEIGGWLLTPLHAAPLRGVIVGHGYGGRDAPDALAGLEDAVLLFPCFRGMGLSPVAGLSAQPYRHVLHGIESRHRYVLGGCVDDLWLGVSALVSLFPEVARRISVMGVSFGGGIAALAAPWDARIRRLFLQVPSFGHQALRLTLPCVGSGEAVRAYQRQHAFNVMETLAYYDAACAARFLSIPTLAAAALFDPAVPPPGQFAIYNAIPPGWRRLSVLPAGHFDYPGKAEREQALEEEVVGFLANQAP
jgi:cephalosporin-C deacetylase